MRVKESIVVMDWVNTRENIQRNWPLYTGEKDRVLNSPWNVAADFKVKMSFSAAEIETMLQDYVQQSGVEMDIKRLSHEIWYFTDGYPYLVSRLCKNIDEYGNKNWTSEGLREAVKLTLAEKNTLLS